MPKNKTTWRDVLVLSKSKADKPDRTKIAKYYRRYRDERGMPVRCDIEHCRFHTELPPEWNGKPLEMTVDHIEGNRYDNLPASLRLLCPNCNVQQDTHGGKNRGRVLWVVEGGYGLRTRDGGVIAAATGKM